MCHGLAAPGLDRPSGLGAVESLDPALFVNRQHDDMGRWIDPRARRLACPRAGSRPDDIYELGGKAGVARALEGAQPVRLQCARELRCTEPAEMLIAFGHCPARSNGSPSAMARGRSALPVPRSPPRSALCPVCGSCRARPSTPALDKRCCHRHTVGRLTLMRCATGSTNADRPRPARCALARRACAVGYGRPRSRPIARAPQRSKSYILVVPWPPSPQAMTQFRISASICESVRG